MAEQEVSTLHAVSFEVEAVRRTRLPFRPPLIEHSPKPQAFEYAWRLLAFVFPFTDPASFPPLPKKSLAPHRDILDRYLSEAIHLAESQYLHSEGEIRISFRDGTVESHFPSKEIRRGFQVTFRQFYSPGDRATFLNVYKVIAGIAKREWDSESREWQQLTLWNKARARLCSKPLKVLVGEKMYPGSNEIANDFPPYPQQLISAYFYGDGIHFDPGHAQDLSALRSTPFDHAWSEYRLGEAVSGLAHLYIGFSGVVRAILADD